MSEYPTNPRTGHPTFRERTTFRDRVEDIEVRPSMLLTDGFLLQSVAEFVYNDYTRWRDVYEECRMWHPAEFDIGDRINLPRRS